MSAQKALESMVRAAVVAWNTDTNHPATINGDASAYITEHIINQIMTTQGDSVFEANYVVERRLVRTPRKIAENVLSGSTYGRWERYIAPRHGMTEAEALTEMESARGHDSYKGKHSTGYRYEWEYRVVRILSLEMVTVVEEPQQEETHPSAEGDNEK